MTSTVCVVADGDLDLRNALRHRQRSNQRGELVDQLAHFGTEHTTPFDRRDVTGEPLAEAHQRTAPGIDEARAEPRLAAVSQGSPARGSSHSAGSSLPMRRSVSRSIWSLIVRCESGDRCCSAHPPQMPKWTQGGSTRSGDGSITRSSSASSWLRSLSAHAVLDQLARQCARDEHGLAASHDAPAIVIQRVDAAGQRRGSTPATARGTPRDGVRRSRAAACGRARIPASQPPGSRWPRIRSKARKTSQVLSTSVSQYRRTPTRSPGLPCVPDLVAREAELAGQAQQRRHVREACARAVLEAGNHVHQVEMSPVKAAQVIVVAEARILIAVFPVTGGRKP